MWILKKVEYMPTNAKGWVCLLLQPTETQGILRPSHKSLTQPCTWASVLNWPSVT